MRRIVTISFTGLEAPGGVPKFNRDLHATFPDRECLHFCWADYPYSDRIDTIQLPEWEKARVLNLYLIKSRKIDREDVVVADGFWAWGLESFPFAISHSHGIWGHVTHWDVLQGIKPENPHHHAAQIAFRDSWTSLGKHITAVSDFIAYEMERQWGFKVDRVINNGVDVDRWVPRTYYLDRKRPLIIHGINDRGNLNKGWDHIELLKTEIDADVLSLDEAAEFVSGTKTFAMQQADLVVHPSGYEGNSMFVAEAMASGVPVIGYDVGYLWKLSGEYPLVMDRRLRGIDMTLQMTRNALDDCNKELMGSLRGQYGFCRKHAAHDLDIKVFQYNWREYVSEVEDAPR